VLSNVPPRAEVKTTSLRPYVGSHEQHLNVIWLSPPFSEAERKDVGRLVPPSLLRKLERGRVRRAGLKSPTGRKWPAGRGLPTPALATPTPEGDAAKTPIDCSFVLMTATTFLGDCAPGANCIDVAPIFN